MTDPSKFSIIWTEANTSLKTHAPLIVAAGVLSIAGWATVKIVNHNAEVDHDKAVQSQTILQQQATQNAQIAEQVKQEQQTLQQFFLQQQAQNAALVSAITARNQQVVVQQKSDASLPPTELAARWNFLLGTTGQVQTASGGYAVTESAAVSTTQQLEELPVLQANVGDLQIQIANKDKVIDDGKKLVDDQTSQIKGLGVQIVDGQKACAATITAVKAEARRGKLKWFGIGYVAGLMTRGAIKIFTGL